MSRLTAAARRDLRPSQFAIPPTRSHPGEYPIEDVRHARDALARVDEFGSQVEKTAVRHAVAINYPGVKQSK